MVYFRDQVQTPLPDGADTPPPPQPAFQDGGAPESLSDDDSSSVLSDAVSMDVSSEELLQDDSSDSSSEGQPDLPEEQEQEEQEQEQEQERAKDSLDSVLPIHTALPDMRAVIIRRMTDAELSLTYLEIEEAGRRGQGFGEQEWRDEADFRQDIAGSRCLAVVEARSGQLLASVILAISRFYRGREVADPYLVVRAAQRSRGLGDFCLGWAVRLARLAGFLAMYVDTFSTNAAMIKILRRSPFRFTEVGCLPLGGRLASGKMAETLIFYLDLQSVDLAQPPRPLITQP